MNADILEGKWKQMRGAVQERWGRLTNDDLEMIAGKRKKLAGKLQERYGYSRQKAEAEINSFMKDFNSQLSEARAKVETAAQEAQDKAEQVQADLTRSVAEQRRRIESTTSEFEDEARQLNPQQQAGFLQRNRWALLIGTLILGAAAFVLLRQEE